MKKLIALFCIPSTIFRRTAHKQMRIVDDEDDAMEDRTPSNTNDHHKEEEKDTLRIEDEH